MSFFTFPPGLRVIACPDDLPPPVTAGGVGVSVPAFLEARRSIRAFTGEAVARATLDALVEAACIAPAPHHSRPWRRNGR